MANYTADISSELNQIKNAKYGEEVRDSIVSAIRKINTVTEDFTTAINAIVAEIQEAAADEGITPIDTSVLADYATKEYVDLAVNGQDVLYRCDLIQAAMSSLTQGKTVDNTGAIVDADGHHFMSDVFIDPSQDLTVMSSDTSLFLGYAIYRSDTKQFVALNVNGEHGDNTITIATSMLTGYHYVYKLLLYWDVTADASPEFIRRHVHTTYSRLDLLEDAIDSLTPGGSPDLSGYLTKAEFNQEMVNYANINDVDPYTVLANSLVWKKKAGSSGAVVDGDFHYYVSSKIICPSRDIVIKCDMSTARLGYIAYYNDGSYFSEVLPDREGATNSISMPAITIGNRNRCYRLLLYLPASSDMDRTLWLRGQFNTLYGRVDSAENGISDLEEDISSLQPAYLQMSLGTLTSLHNGVECVVPFDTIDAAEGSSISQSGNAVLISESGKYEVTAVCGLTGLQQNISSAVLEVKHMADGGDAWQSDIKHYAYPENSPYFMQAGPIIKEYETGDTVEASVTLASSSSTDVLGNLSSAANYTYLLIRKL